MSLVSVLMAVYNGELFLGKAVESILKQTFTDFEFIIINDASTDGSLEIIKSYDDSRIKLVNDPENLGLTKSLNKGLKLAKGKYIARMDADDVSLPQRLEKQVEFMEEHPEVGVCGTWLRGMKKNEGVVIKYETQHEDIKLGLLIKNRIAHPTAMIRRSILKKYDLNYDTSFLTSQDYDLWLRMSKICKLANLEEPLVLYRFHEEQASVKKKQLQIDDTNRIRVRQLRALGITDLSENEIQVHLNMVLKYKVSSYKELYARHQWISKLRRANSKSCYFNKIKFTGFLIELWGETIRSLKDSDLQSIFLIFKSSFTYKVNKSFKLISQLVTRSIRYYLLRLFYE